MQALSAEGLEAIVVGIPNTKQRGAEYSPFASERIREPRGDAYLRFLVETLKPEIDRGFRTRPDRASTGIMGASLGGTISL